MQTMQNVTVDLSMFTDMELQAIELAASSKNMTLVEYIVFLLSGVATPSKD